MSKVFLSKKNDILRKLDTPESEYTDKSPKGSLDTAIRPLVELINSYDGLVTTSSCSGRVSIYLEGAKKESEPSGEGSYPPSTRTGHGNWLYVSHDTIVIPDTSDPHHFHSLFGLETATSGGADGLDSNARFVHFKFEPAILHVLASSCEWAQKVISAALAAGYRESGALSIHASGTNEATPVVAVRSTGLAFDCIIAHLGDTGVVRSLVDDSHLRLLVRISNARFVENVGRMDRLMACLRASTAASPEVPLEGKAERSARMKAEYLQRQVQGDRSVESKHLHTNEEDVNLELLDLF